MRIGDRDAGPKGWIFDIQRFSTHDGPGIRTTVFFSGCGLRCKWCHNPESWIAAPQILTYPELCIGCLQCVAVCERGARRAKGGRIVYGREACEACGACAEVCPAEAVRQSGKHVPAQDVVDEVLRDRPFYETSNGGVTLSGGEPLAQPEFAAAVVGRCSDEDIHTAIETAAFVPWQAFEAVLPFAQLFLLDVKLMDSARHREATGAGNEMVVENARRLADTGIPIVIRMPIIPTVNDAADDVRAVARFAASLPNVNEMELLRFHRLASRKARSLGIEDWAAEKATPSDDLMRELVAVAAAEGVAVRIG